MFSEISFWQYGLFFAFAGYLFFFLPTMFRMWREGVVLTHVVGQAWADYESSWMRKVNRWASHPYSLFPYRWWSRMKLGANILILAVPLFLAFLVDILILPLFAFFLFRKEDEQDKEEERQRQRQVEENRRHEIAKENARRESMRRWWFESNPPVLYAHTIAGITAVLTPLALRGVEEATRRAIRNEEWEYFPLLVPSDHTALFVTKSGKKLLEQPGNPHPHGWLTDLDDLVAKWGARVETRLDIFVPFVNESLVPFREQKYLRAYSSDLERILIISQAPAEMRPIDK